MSRKKKKARPAVGAAGQAVENGNVCKAAQPSIKYDTISAAGRQPFHVADLLLIGEENALPMRHLRAVTNLSSREIRMMIQQERLAGVPICANNATGYFIAANDEERGRFIRSMRHRSAEIARVADALDQAEV